MKTKQELVSWLTEVRNWGNSVWVVCNGGGISCVAPDLIDGLIDDILNEDKYGDIEVLDKGSEFGDFKAVMPAADYEGTECFVRVNHNTAYNQENADYQIQYYEL